MKVFLNRAACWLKIRAFENCIKDVKDLEELLSRVPKEERDSDEFYAKLHARALVKKGAAQTYLSEWDDALATWEEAIAIKGGLGNAEIASIHADIEEIDDDDIEES